MSRRLPRSSQWPKSFQGRFVGDLHGNVYLSADHLITHNPQEVAGGNVVIKDDEDGGPDPVVVGGTLRGIVADVGSQAAGHCPGPHGPALPLQEEVPGDAATAQHADGVWLDGPQPVAVAEVPGSPVERVQLHNFPPGGAGLLGQGGDEPVHRSGMLDVAEQLAAAPAGNVAPRKGFARVDEGGDPPFPRHPHQGLVPPGQEPPQPTVGEGHATPAARHPNDQLRLEQRRQDLGLICPDGCNTFHVSVASVLAAARYSEQSLGIRPLRCCQYKQPFDAEQYGLTWGVETQRQWSGQAIARTTPILMGLFSWTTLAAHLLRQQRPSAHRTAAWYAKPSPTFVDAIALVRRHLWLASEGFSLSAADPDIRKVPAALYHRLVDSLAYAA